MAQQNNIDVPGIIISDPIRITEARKLPLNATGRGAICDYYLECVKMQTIKGCVKSSAILKISDRSGEVTCMLEGAAVGRVFGLSPRKWKDIEKLNQIEDNLFYRQFKKGVSATSSIAQKLFYNFCHSNQIHNVLFVSFKRVINYRKGETTKPFLLITKVVPPNEELLNLFLSTKAFYE